MVAIGGNAISRPGEDDSVRQDLANLRRSLTSVVELVERGCEVVLTHGNGPQVGNQMIRVELARGQAPDLPLDVVVADLQGGLGYMIELVLRNKLHAEGIDKTVCALLSLVEVSPDDPALGRPSKFVGPAFPESRVHELEQRGWVMHEDKGRGWRRVVPSPNPLEVIGHRAVVTLIETGALVIVTGGGGIPVAREDDGSLRGVEAVIDKDLASAVLGVAIGAHELYVLTAVSQVMLGFGTPEARPLTSLRVAEARRLIEVGEFPAGSMGPKIEAACRFVEGGGQRALITDVFTLTEALDGTTGTWIVP